MTQSMENDFQRLVIERLDKIDSDIAGLKQDTKDTNTKFDIYVKASEKVEKATHERKEGTLKSGPSGKKVTSKKQAIAIGLSQARKVGAKVPRKNSSSKKK